MIHHALWKKIGLWTADLVSGTNFLKHAINEYNRETLKWTPLSDERREGGSGDEEHTPHLRTHLEKPSHLQLHRENVSYAKGSGVVSLIWAIIEYWLNSSIYVILWQFSLANIWFRNFVRLTNRGHGIYLLRQCFLLFQAPKILRVSSVHGGSEQRGVLPDSQSDPLWNGPLRLGRQVKKNQRILPTTTM